jgi:hypothetical protein
LADPRESPVSVPKGKANGNYKTGRFTYEAIEQHHQLKAWIRMMGQFAEDVK